MIKVTLEFKSAQEAIDFLNGPTNVVGAPTPAAVPPALRNMVAAAPAAPAPLPPVAAAPAAPAPVAAPATSVAPAPRPPAPPAPPAAAAHGITQAQLAAQAQAYSKAYKPAATKAVFSHFGITKIGDADSSIYPDLMQALQVLEQ